MKVEKIMNKIKIYSFEQAIKGSEILSVRCFAF